MPQFRQIGGLLADEMQLNTDDLNSAIAAINQAVDHNAANNLLIEALQNPMATLLNVQPMHAEKYRMVIAAEKRQKNESAGDINGIVVLDRDEIQDLINSMNRLMGLQRIEDMVKAKNINGLLEAIGSLKPDINTVCTTSLMASILMTHLSSSLQKKDMLRLQDIEDAITAASNKAGSNKPIMGIGNGDSIPFVVRQINQALENGDVSGLLALLKSPCLLLAEHILSFAGSLYFAELDYIRRGSGTDLRVDGITRVCKFLSTVAKINQAAQNKNYDEVFQLAIRPGANLEDLNESMKNRYGESMHTALMAKQKISMTNLKRAESEIACKLLNHADIQDCIDMVNSEEVDYEKIEAIRLVNDAVRSLDHIQLFKALKNPHLELEKNLELRGNISGSIKKNHTPNSSQIQKENYICEEDALHYVCLLRDLQRGHETKDGKLCELWMEDIIETIIEGMNNAHKAKTAAFNLSILHMAVLQRDAEHIFNILSCNDLSLSQGGQLIYEDRKMEYTGQLYQVLSSKEASGASGVWVEHKLLNSDGKVTTVHLNLKDQKHSWRKPRDYNGPRMSVYLCQEEILCVLKNVGSNVTDGASLPGNFDIQIWTKFQARCRGNLVRQRIFTMLRHYYDNEKKVVKVQAYLKGKVQRKKYLIMLHQKVSVYLGKYPF